MSSNTLKKGSPQISSNQSINKDLFGKVPPQVLEYERSLLGALMIQKGAIDEIAPMLQPECLYREDHRIIYEAILELHSTNHPIDIITVTEQVRKNGKLEEIGGTYFVTKLTNDVVSSAHNNHYCKCILEAFFLRKIIEISSEAIASAFDGTIDPFELMGSIESQIANLGIRHVHGDLVGIDTALVETMKHLQKLRDQKTTINGVPSGYPELDRVTLGFQPGDLIIIGARPGEGKTAFLLNLLKNAVQAEPSVPVAVWSLEMNYIRLIFRIFSSMSGIPLYQLQTGRISDEQMKHLYTDVIQKLAKKGIYFDDKPGVTMQQLKAKARRAVRKYKVGLIAVDYLQLMKGKGNTREQEVSGISRELKELAQELNVPVIALSQISREVEKTGRHEPRPSDLRESGAIEQDADLIIFIWRPSEAEIAENANLLNTRRVKIAKARNGLLMTYDADFKPDIQSFENLRQKGTNTVVSSKSINSSGWNSNEECSF